MLHTPAVTLRVPIFGPPIASVPRSPTSHLAATDPALARIIARVGPYRPAARHEGNHFDAVVRAIVYQQISGAAASTILGRVFALFGGISPSPEQLLGATDEGLRAAGLSRQKIGYLRDLAAKAHSGDVPFDALDAQADEEVIAELVKVKGVGRWTAQMFLMFRLERPNVLPVLDLGIQNAIRKAYGLRKRPTPERVAKIGARWAPHATLACWYLWRSLDNGDGQSGGAKRRPAAKVAALKIAPRKPSPRKPSPRLVSAPRSRSRTNR